jgi:hypothetical protein
MSKSQGLNWVHIFGLLVGILGLVQFPMWWSAREAGEPHGGGFIFIGAVACTLLGFVFYLGGFVVRAQRATRRDD